MTGKTEVRTRLWSDWAKLLGALQAAVGEVAACWLAGSFFSAKPEPGDIDCVWIIDTARLQSALAQHNAQLELFIRAAGENQARELYGLNIDSFILEWMPHPGSGRPFEAEQYFGTRGYWDNLWVRRRDQDARLDSVPRRGYLEVILDGYR